MFSSCGPHLGHLQTNSIQVNNLLLDDPDEGHKIKRSGLIKFLYLLLVLLKVEPFFKIELLEV